MKIENGKIKYEYRTCWDCEGKKTVVRNRLCPNWGKKTYRKKCPVCGGIGKNGHKTIGQYTKVCDTCNGEGVRLENSCDSMTKAERINWLENVTFKFVENQKKTFNDSYIGIGNLCGITDYTDHRHDKGIVEKIKSQLLNDTTLQYTKIIKNGKLCNVVYCKGQYGGYTAVAGYESVGG